MNLEDFISQPINWAELARMQFEAAEELEIQARIVQARKFYDGQFSEALYTYLQEKIVGGELNPSFEGFNINPIIINGLVDRLIALHFKCNEEELQTLANAWWLINRMDGKQSDIYRRALRDGESFLLITWEPDQEEITETVQLNGFPRFWLHKRYTDPTIGGDGEGMVVRYLNDNPENPPIFAVKRWTEHTYEPDGSQDFILRKTIYFPDRIEKYRADDSGNWEQHRDEGDTTWPIPWIHQGQPIGIPVIHFQAPERQSRLRRSIGPQMALDQAVTDLLVASSLAAPGTIAVTGMFPTTDGQPPKEDNSNVWRLGPGRIIGNRQEGSVTRLAPANLDSHLKLIDKIFLWASIINEAPRLSHIQFSAHAVSAQALEQYESGMVSEALRLQKDYAHNWRQVFRLAVHLSNIFNATNYNQTPIIPQWSTAQPRSDETIRQNAEAKATTGVPWEEIMREWGYSPEDIAAMPRPQTENRAQSESQTPPEET